ncbi:hypothetical protein BLNAU_11320 [Blattamonas nauphoetae]|uniref:Uncharacterized protein n=1 Tax=Blattamonas nauphoetae TaxID=2049346 RepID=A0ABQ9XQW5_9EUKA|nr:hypothetical protein BLNAU_11320 [Blattamonas nauphoetae]
MDIRLFWETLCERIPEREQHEIKTMIGRNLIDQNQRLLQELNGLMELTDIYEQMVTERTNEIETFRPTTSRQREYLEKEILITLERLQENRPTSAVSMRDSLAMTSRSLSQTLSSLGSQDRPSTPILPREINFLNVTPAMISEWQGVLREEEALLLRQIDAVQEAIMAHTTVRLQAAQFQREMRDLANGALRAPSQDDLIAFKERLERRENEERRRLKESRKAQSSSHNPMISLQSPKLARPSQPLYSPTIKQRAKSSDSDRTAHTHSPSSHTTRHTPPISPPTSSTRPTPNQSTTTQKPSPKPTTPPSFEKSNSPARKKAAQQIKSPKVEPTPPPAKDKADDQPKKAPSTSSKVRTAPVIRGTQPKPIETPPRPAAGPKKTEAPKKAEAPKDWRGERKADDGLSGLIERLTNTADLVTRHRAEQEEERTSAERVEKKEEPSAQTKMADLAKKGNIPIPPLIPVTLPFDTDFDDEALLSGIDKNLAETLRDTQDDVPIASADPFESTVRSSDLLTTRPASSILRPLSAAQRRMRALTETDKPDTIINNHLTSTLRTSSQPHAQRSQKRKPATKPSQTVEEPKDPAAFLSFITSATDALNADSEDSSEIDDVLVAQTRSYQQYKEILLLNQLDDSAEEKEEWNEEDEEAQMRSFFASDS